MGEQHDLIGESLSLNLRQNFLHGTALRKAIRSYHWCIESSTVIKSIMWISRSKICYLWRDGNILRLLTLDIMSRYFWICSAPEVHHWNGKEESRIFARVGLVRENIGSCGQRSDPVRPKADTENEQTTFTTCRRMSSYRGISWRRTSARHCCSTVG